MHMKRLLFVLLLLTPSLIHAQDIEIFAMYEDFPVEKGVKIHFIPLTGKYQFYKNTDTSVIPPRFLGYNSHSGKNYHKLDSVRRSTFLGRVGISESDTIFIYSLVNDTIYKREAAEVPLVAFLDLYTHEPPFKERNYMIGFAMDTGGFKPDKSYFTSLVFVGRKNPFVTGNREAISWQKADSTGFPNISKDTIRASILSSFRPTNTYTFSTEELDYFAQDMIHKEKSYLRARQVVVIQKQTGNIWYNKIHTDGESSNLTPLISTTRQSNQWTGKIFADKPPILYGFKGVIFGCPLIEFTDQQIAPIWVHCDNRH